MKNILEKAKTSKHYVGEVHPNGKWVWTEYAPGKFDWKSKKGKHGVNNTSQISQQTQELKQKVQKPNQPVQKPQQPQQSTQDSKQSQPVHQNKKEYTFKTKKPDVDIKINKWTQESKKTSRRETFTYSDIREEYKKLSDDKLLNILNSSKIPGERRHIAYEIASERNIPENKIDVSGSLQTLWNNQKAMQEDLHSNDNADEEDEWETVDTGLGDFNIEEFMSQFPDNDMGWINPDDERVQKEFNKLKTLKDRQLYDNFVDQQKRLNPNYVSAKKQLGRMKKGYLAFLSENSTRPMMVAAGGAGVGKTYGLRQVMETYKGMKIYDEEEAKKTEDQGNEYTDYDAIFAPQINSLPKLAKFLSKHSDKVVIFDDNDDLLTNSDMANVMKTLCDPNPSARYFPEYNGPDGKEKATGKNKVFKGKLIILTNKSNDVLNRNTDAVAIMSRSSYQEINFTVQENIDILKDRYKKMDTGVKIPGVTADEEQQIREDVFNYIVNNKNKLDPSKFTVRKFINIYEKISQEKEAEIMAKTSADAAEDFEPEDWRDSALSILNKANEDELFNYNVAFFDPESEWTPEIKKELSSIAKKIDSEEEDDQEEDELITGKKEKEVQKGLFDNMSLSEAEDLLLG